ncbi:hypothetical protein [Desulfitobacterium sp. AusDCA]|uniref:hypothetical protein n=1 Tax=Desulfitobacterium sp. AusDCA TaxID=3240383 RepID=UPI003DA6E7EE
MRETAVGLSSFLQNVGIMPKDVIIKDSACLLSVGRMDILYPVDFSLPGLQKRQINGISPKIDMRTSGYQWRMEALKPTTELIPQMIDQALASRMTASYVLMNIWFTYAPLKRLPSVAWCHRQGLKQPINVIYIVVRQFRFRNYL